MTRLKVSDTKTFNLNNSYAKELHEISEKCIPTGFKQAEFILKNYNAKSILFENGVTEIGKMVDGVITFNIDSNESDEE